MPINVAIVEDDTSLRKRFRQQFELYPEVRCVGAFATGEALLASLKTWEPSRIPHVVLMDIGLPGMSGIETTAAVKEFSDDIDVLMITVFEDEQRIFQSVQAGAMGYLLKDDAPDDIMEAIRELHNGGAPMSRSIARKVLAAMREPAPARPSNVPDANLSDREVELLQGLVAGESHTRLADRLFLSPHTVRTHIKNIYKKLHVHTRATAVRAAIDRKLV